MSDATTPVSDSAQGAPLMELALPAQDLDPVETQEWLESLEYVLKTRGAERVKFLLDRLEKRARMEGVELPIASNTPYVNTIARDKQPR